jgi:hypothetical protein
MEASMAGLVPEKRTRQQLERANAELIERHKRHLESWTADKAATAARRTANTQLPPKQAPAESSNKR